MQYSLLLDNLREAFHVVGTVAEHADESGEQDETCKTPAKSDPIGHLFFGTQRTFSSKPCINMRDDEANSTSNGNLTREARDLVLEVKDEILGLNLNSVAPAHPGIFASMSSPSHFVSSPPESFSTQSQSQRHGLRSALKNFFAWSQCTLEDRGVHERRIDFERLPPILTVHLPRVRWDPSMQRSVVDAVPLPFEDTLVLDPYVCIDKQDMTTNALGGMRARREKIARDLAQLNIDGAIRTLLRFTDKAKDRRNNVSLSRYPIKRN